MKEQGTIVKCDSCGQWHHKGSECPSETKQPEEGFCMNQKKSYLITKAERSFWEAIKASLPENHYVFPQINSTAFIYKADDSRFHNELLEMMKNSKHFGGNRYPSTVSPWTPGMRMCRHTPCSTASGMLSKSGTAGAQNQHLRSTGTALPPPPLLPPYGANPSCYFPFPVLQYPWRLSPFVNLGVAAFF